MTRARVDRAYGALLGLALGDALGMPTQCLPRAVIRKRYGLVETFEPGPPDNEISAGMPAGRVTDDTDQAVILGRLLVKGGGDVDPGEFARELLAWERRMRESGSLDLLGPSTRRALQAVSDGVSPDESGRWGDTNGAAMRVTPVGIAAPWSTPEDLAHRVHAVGRVTHNTTVATAGATAVAAAVSVAVDGASIREAVAAGVAGARAGAELGHYVPGADVATRIAWAIEVVDGLKVEDALDRLDLLVGTGVSTQEAVPATFALVSLLGHDPWLTCRAAASLGGDCDTIAAMAGAMVGALHGASVFPAPRVVDLENANPGLGLARLADDLLAVRDSVARRAGA